MKVTYTPADLIKFEDDICDLFAQRKIRAPVHLDNGNEAQLIKVFENFVDDDDWVCGSWRQHLKTLLKGVPPEELKQAIIDGKSISLCFPKHRVISSAIVGGIQPIAVGLAMGIKKRSEKHKVVCFLGDMTAETGIFHECLKYSINHELPILFVIECNHKSVCTSTLPTWNMRQYTYGGGKELGSGVFANSDKVLWFEYQSRFPHAGTGERIQF